ncbi:hypothetical protein XNW1_4290055 [Xenorhabdus nematophila str. Websteri]|nr:hypothetical protein XNW1_4290055 [Xenorhabdus nematophila str. Websteri]
MYGVKECCHQETSELLKRVEKIFISEEPAVRIDLLFSYLWSKNANQIYQARKEK